MIDYQKLKSLFSACKGRVKYKLGGKAAFSKAAADIKAIDCSGWARWHLYHAAGITMPDGSQMQLAWARANLRKLNQYSDAATYAGNDANRLFIAFLSPKPKSEWPRHVWFVYMGKTMESHSSGGVNSRPWNTRALAGCKECFEVL